VIVWFMLASIANTSNLCRVPCWWKNSGGTITLVTEAGRSMLNTRRGSSCSTITW
jgi:hypothetical protein